MFGFRKRALSKRSQGITGQVEALRSYLSKRVQQSLIIKYGSDYGCHLAEGVVCRWLAHPSSINQTDLPLVEQLATDIVIADQGIRDAVFIALRAMLDVEGTNRNYAAERRILDALQWMKQFGEIPADNSRPETLKSAIHTLSTLS